LRVKYRKLFLKDLKKLKHTEIYHKIYEIVFETLPQIKNLGELKNIKSMKGHPNRYRIRVGEYRIGIEVHNDEVEIMRVLHRREFYRYFP